MNIQNLPIERQNNIFYYTAEHPCAKVIKAIFKEQLVVEVDYVEDDDGETTLKETAYNMNIFQINEDTTFMFTQDFNRERVWNNLINLIKNKSIDREELGDHYLDL